MYREDGNWPRSMRFNFEYLETRYFASMILESTKTGPCSYDKILDTMIHRFDSGSYRCRCGQSEVKPPESKTNSHNTIHPKNRKVKSTDN